MEMTTDLARISFHAGMTIMLTTYICESHSKGKRSWRDPTGSSAARPYVDFVQRCRSCCWVLCPTLFVRLEVPRVEQGVA